MFPIITSRVYHVISDCCIGKSLFAAHKVIHITYIHIPTSTIVCIYVQMLHIFPYQTQEGNKESKLAAIQIVTT